MMMNGVEYRNEKPDRDLRDFLNTYLVYRSPQAEKVAEV